MNREFIDFVTAHRNDDTARLLLSAHAYPDIDVPLAVQQIEGLRSASLKWPHLLDHPDFRFPPRLNREQASSFATATFKASLLPPGLLVADLTGGMGIDTLAFARTAAHVHYVELDPDLCSLMRQNSLSLGFGNISVHCDDCFRWLASHPPLDALFVDPARRNASGRKVAAFSDSQPDILAHLDLLLDSCRTLLVKASPMVDIDLASSQLRCVSDVFVVAVGGECKELLFKCSRSQSTPPLIHCFNLPPDGSPPQPSLPPFSRSDETSAHALFASSVGNYLFEPSADLMKGGGYNLIASHWNILPLGRNSHLYTSDRLIHPFPGRTFRVIQEIKLNRRCVASALPDGKAHVLTRNYPVAAATLQHQLGLREGGNLFLIATTLCGSPRGFLCSRDIA